MAYERDDPQIELRPDKRRADVVASGTFACPECDAPVAPDRALTLTERVVCPFCHHAAAARDFLSLAQPTRAAHVVVRVSGTRVRVR